MSWIDKAIGQYGSVEALVLLLAANAASLAATVPDQPIYPELPQIRQANEVSYVVPAAPDQFITTSDNWVDTIMDTNGDIAAIVELWKLNRTSYSDTLTPGDKLDVPELAPSAEVYQPIPFSVPVGFSTEATIGQSALDLALQAGGSVESLIDLLIGNGLSPESRLVAGRGYTLPAARDGRIASFYTARGLRVATSQAVDDAGIFDFSFDFTFE